MENVKIAVIGLGYVGLPLARLFSTKYETVGFDMNRSRVDALMAGHDATLEVADDLLQRMVSGVRLIWRISGIVIFMWWRYLLLWTGITTRI